MATPGFEDDQADTSNIDTPADASTAARYAFETARMAGTEVQEEKRRRLLRDTNTSALRTAGMQA